MIKSWSSCKEGIPHPRRSQRDDRLGPLIDWSWQAYGLVTCPIDDKQCEAHYDFPANSLQGARHDVEAAVSRDTVTGDIIVTTRPGVWYSRRQGWGPYVVPPAHQLLHGRVPLLPSFCFSSSHSFFLYCSSIHLISPFTHFSSVLIPLFAITFTRCSWNLKHKDSFGKSENLSKKNFTEILVFHPDYECKSSSSNGLLWISFIYF